MDINSAIAFSESVPSSFFEDKSQFRRRQLLLMGRLQESISHEIMNNLTKAVLRMDAGELDTSKRAIYHSASLLQDLQQLGFQEDKTPAKKSSLSRLFHNAMALSKGLLNEIEILTRQDLKDRGEIQVHFQIQLVGLIDLLLLSADSLRKSYNRRIEVSTLSTQDQVKACIEVSGSAVDMSGLEKEALDSSKKIIEFDGGSFFLEKNPLGFKMNIIFPRIVFHPKA